jgi:hypothetical protein
MPRSQYVSASRLKPLVIYFACAVLALLIADALVRAFADAPVVRILAVIAWFVWLPYGAWRIWTRGG